MNKLEYKWEQTSDYITILINITEDIKIKDICVNFKPKYLKISINDKILEGELFKPTYDVDSSWYVDNKTLSIELPKVIISDNYHWEKLFINDIKDYRKTYVKMSELSDKKRMEHFKNQYDLL